MAMPVTDENALPLLRAFARLEFLLKNDPGFLRAGPYRMAQVNWPAVGDDVLATEAREINHQRPSFLHASGYWLEWLQRSSRTLFEDS